jgi:hypothetical protein
MAEFNDDDVHSENADMKSAPFMASHYQSGVADQPPWKRRVVAQVRNFWLKHGTLCQDVVVQITYLVPEIIVAMELSRKYVGEVSACTVPNSNALKGTAIQYQNSNRNTNYASFSDEFFLRACEPFWPDGNRVCWEIFVAAMFFHQVTFLCINFLKVSSAVPVNAPAACDPFRADLIFRQRE